MGQTRWTKALLDETIEKMDGGLNRMEIANQMGISTDAVRVALLRHRRKPTLEALKEENRRLKEEISALRSLIK